MLFVLICSAPAPLPHRNQKASVLVRSPVPTFVSTTHTPAQGMSLPADPPVQGSVSCSDSRSCSFSSYSKWGADFQCCQEATRSLCGVGVLSSPPPADCRQLSLANKAWLGPRMCCQGNQAPSSLCPTSHSSLGSLCVCGCVTECIQPCASAHV